LPQTNFNLASFPYTGPRFFAQKVNTNPVIIKEIDEKTYTSLQTSPLYITTYISNTQSLTQANTQMPGLKEFLEG